MVRRPGGSDWPAAPSPRRFRLPEAAACKREVKNATVRSVSAALSCAGDPSLDGPAELRCRTGSVRRLLDVAGVADLLAFYEIKRPLPHTATTSVTCRAACSRVDECFKAEICRRAERSGEQLRRRPGPTARAGLF